MPRKRKKKENGAEPGLYELIVSMGTPQYEKALKEHVVGGGRLGLVGAIKNSNLHPAEKRVLTDLITGKLKRPAKKTRDPDTHFREWRRALKVLDLEATGEWPKRYLAIEEAANQLKCSEGSIERALKLHEEYLSSLRDRHDMDWLRSALRN